MQEDRIMIRYGPRFRLPGGTYWMRFDFWKMKLVDCK